MTRTRYIININSLTSFKQLLDEHKNTFKQAMYVIVNTRMSIVCVTVN